MGGVRREQRCGLGAGTSWRRAGGAGRSFGVSAGSGRRVRALPIAVLAAGALAGFGLAVPATASPLTAPVIGGVPAHSELLSSTPADGATLTQPPSQIVLVFNEEVNASFVTVALTKDGAAVALAAPAVTGATVTSAVPAGPGAGSYRIAYRVVSKDGHPISGATEFVVTAATATASPTAPPTSTAAASSAPASPTVSATPVATQPTSTASSVPVVLGVGGAVLLVAAGGGLLAWRRRQKSA